MNLLDPTTLLKELSEVSLEALLTEAQNFTKADLIRVIWNYVSSEDTQHREKEKEILLGLNTAIASANHPDELLPIISRHLHEFVGFTHMLISKIDEETLTAGTYLLHREGISQDSKVIQELLEINCPVNDPIFNKTSQSSQPQLFDLEEMNSKISLPVYLRASFEQGAKKVIMVRLAKGIKVFGFWVLYFDTNEAIPTGVADILENAAGQISIAITNFIAGQELERKEHEKAKLLAFSNVIVSVRDKNMLAKILKNQLKKLLDIEDYVIHSLSDDKQKFSPILFDPDADFVTCPEFIKLLDRQNDVNDGIFDQILDSDEPVFFSIENYLDKSAHLDYLNSASGIKLQQIIGVNIRLGQETIAVMTFTHNDYEQIINQFHLFKSILSQIALTVSNIIANEKVNRQLEEIKSYKHRLEEEKVYLKEEIETAHNYSEIIGDSPIMQKTFRMISVVAPSDSTVLLLGETGTGKELVARAIHNNSPRRNKLMVKVNCAALPANLIESELFGHEKGSFTGATERRLGKFELANNGTLFLDEVGEMPLDLQVKLLRALQEREIERVGGSTTIKVNVRIIAATNRDLEKEMQEGRFRRDLYYRLNIFPIDLPSLRLRKEDIPLLVNYFVQRFAKKSRKPINTINNKALQELVQYQWPGNIRELEHLIERSVLLADGDTIKQFHLPQIRQQLTTGEPEFIIKTIDEHERGFILKTLKYCNGKIGGDGGAAMLLDVPTSTLNSKIKRLGIKKEHIMAAGKAV